MMRYSEYLKRADDQRYLSLGTLSHTAQCCFVGTVRCGDMDSDVVALCCTIPSTLGSMWLKSRSRYDLPVAVMSGCSRVLASAEFG